MTFEVTILGSNSAIPAHGRHPTSQVINLNENLYLVDCGEGTQILLNKYRIKFHKIDHVFISHLHGDHFFGLIGLITSFHLNHREKPLTIFSPEGIEEIITTQLKFSSTKLCYPLVFKAFIPKMGAIIFENDSVRVETLELKHRIPCAGFVFREKKRKEKNIIKEKIDEFKIPVSQIAEIKSGKDLILADGTIVKNETLTIDAPEPRSYAYCTDTAYNEDMIPFIKEVDLLYHEATFNQARLDRAIETCHSTTIQAATIAKEANARKLIIGHFSARYKNLDDLILETKSVFKNSHLAIEGSSFSILNN